MKKFLVALVLVAALVMAGGVVGAQEGDEPVSNEPAGDLVDEGKADEAVTGEPVPGEKKEDAGEEADYVRPDVEGEVGITAIGIELEEGADVVATGIDENGKRLIWVYGGAAAVLVLLGAVFTLRRKKAAA